MKTSTYIKYILLIFLAVYGIAAFIYSFFAFFNGAFGIWLLAAGLTLGLLLLADLIALIAVKRFRARISLYDVHMRAGRAITLTAGLFCIITGYISGSWMLLLLVYVFFTIIPSVPASMALAYFLHGSRPEIMYTDTEIKEEEK